MLNANNKDADQPRHPRSLISIFIVPCLDNYNTYTCYIQNFKTLASLSSWAGWFASYLVANPRRQDFLMPWLNWCLRKVSMRTQFYSACQKPFYFIGKKCWMSLPSSNFQLLTKLKLFTFLSWLFQFPLFDGHTNAATNILTPTRSLFLVLKKSTLKQGQHPCW